MVLLINTITQFIEALKSSQLMLFGDPVRISKYKNIFAKAYTQNWSKEVFAVRKIKDT